MTEKDSFYIDMENAIKEHEPIYGNSWKTMPIGQLENRLKNKIEEFNLTKNPKKLISIANLSMLLHKRIYQNG